MKKLLLLALLSSGSCFADVAASNVVTHVCAYTGSVVSDVAASNVVANVCAYTGSVVIVSGKIDSVRKDSMSSCSYIVTMQGLNVRVFFDPNKQVVNPKTFKYQRATFDNIIKPAVGHDRTYTGMVKTEMGKPFLVTEKQF